MGDEQEFCEHIVTIKDVCVDCKKKIFSTENRPCIECCYFYKISGIYGHCKKYCMAVSPDMKVYFKISEGTCFKEKAPI